MNDAAASRRDVIVIGGSQGALAVTRKLLADLPRELNAAVAITLHRSPTFSFALAELFAQRSTLPVVEPQHGQVFERRHVYVAPRDRHLILRGGALWLDHGPKQHHARPAIDATFSSAAKAYGARVIGVLLSGNLSDGVTGLVQIKEHGGLSLAQDPSEAEAPAMPMNAITFDDVDAVVSLATLAPLLTRLVAGERLENATLRAGLRPVRHRPSARKRATGLE